MNFKTCCCISIVVEQVMDDESEEKKLTRIGIAWLLFGPKVANSNNVYQAFITNFEELC